MYSALDPKQADKHDVLVARADEDGAHSRAHHTGPLWRGLTRAALLQGCGGALVKAVVDDLAGNAGHVGALFLLVSLVVRLA